MASIAFDTGSKSLIYLMDIFQTAKEVKVCPKSDDAFKKFQPIQFVKKFL